MHAGAPCGGGKKSTPTKPDAPAADLTTAANDGTTNFNYLCIFYNSIGKDAVKIFDFQLIILSLINSNLF